MTNQMKNKKTKRKVAALIRNSRHLLLNPTSIKSHKYNSSSNSSSNRNSSRISNSNSSSSNSRNMVVMEMLRWLLLRINTRMRKMMLMSRR